MGAFGVVLRAVGPLWIWPVSVSRLDGLLSTRPRFCGDPEELGFSEEGILVVCVPVDRATARPSRTPTHAGTVIQVLSQPAPIPIFRLSQACSGPFITAS